jgi:hypothetical protein
MRRRNSIGVVTTAGLVLSSGIPSGCVNSDCTVDPACVEPEGLVQIPAAESIPDPSSDYDVNCMDPAPGDGSFCNATGRYIGREYDPNTRRIGPIVAGIGRVDVLSAISNCNKTCNNETTGGLKLNVSLFGCTVSAGGVVSTTASSNETTELQKHAVLNLPNADDGVEWDLTRAPTALRSFCTDLAHASNQVVLELWTGRIKVETTAKADAFGGAKLCCGDQACLDATLVEAANATNLYVFEGTVGVKLAHRDDFCNGARQWLKRRCSAATPEASYICGDPWWR